jgi:D-alanyl-D-alanine dipeptidase
MADPARRIRHRALLLAAVLAAACRTAPSPANDTSSGPLADALQAVVVTTSAWDATEGSMVRFARASRSSPWLPVGDPVPLVVGRTGLAWGVGFDDLAVAPDGESPRKREGDGKSPAGIFPIGQAFGFAPADSMAWLRLPYLQLGSGTECVDDTASGQYNRVVERTAVAGVDWRSSERMREIGVYRLGAIVAYNAAPPVRGRGSCIFLHVWAGPRSTTSGCTALDERVLRELLAWLDPRAAPLLVQLPAAAYARQRARWHLPPLDQ